MSRAQFSIMGKGFNQMRLDADEVLNKAVWNMKKQGQEDAEVVIKIKIKAGDEEPFVPEFEHSVSSVLKMKTEKKGGGMLAELEWDAGKQRFMVVKEEAGAGQMSFEDLQADQEAEEEERRDGPMPDLSDEEEDAMVYGGDEEAVALQEEMIEDQQEADGSDSEAEA